MTRKEIENKWLKLSENKENGFMLCIFICLYFSEYHLNIWDNKIWMDSDHIYMSTHFYDDCVTSPIDEDSMTYLCRALSLNMFLDDNNIK